MDQKNTEKDITVGWDAIDKALAVVYSNQVPQHYAPTVYYSLGGDQPLDGISIYLDESNKCYHYVSYGFSELYSKESEDDNISGYGFELTFRLMYEVAESAYPIWPVNLLQNIAKVVFERGITFDEYQTLSSGPIRVSPTTMLTGIIFLIDPALGIIQSQNGQIKFLEIYGLTKLEYDAIVSKTVDRREFLQQQKENNPLMITEVDRK
jgi:hypothetical protein